MTKHQIYAKDGKPYIVNDYEFYNFDNRYQVKPLEEFSFFQPNESYDDKVSSVYVRCRELQRSMWNVTCEIYQTIQDHPVEMMIDKGFVDSAIDFAIGNIEDLTKFLCDMQNAKKAVDVGVFNPSKLPDFEFG